MKKLKWNKEFALDQAADDLDLLRELIEIFKGSCGNDVAEIERGLDTLDTALVSGAAHSIKGAAASLGIEAMRDIALSIETDSRSGSLAVAAEKIDELKELYGALMEMQL